MRSTRKRSSHVSFGPHWSLVALLLSGLHLMAPEIRSADICADFSTLVSASRDGFEEVRGELISSHQDPVHDMRVLYQCKKMLSGANTCEIEWFRQTYTYNAYWHRQGVEAHAKVFEALAELLEGCGLTFKESSKTGRSRWYQVEGEVDFDITLAYNSYRVRISFSKVGFPNP